MHKRTSISLVLAVALAACTADEEPVVEDFGFDGTCVSWLRDTAKSSTVPAES